MKTSSMTSNQIRTAGQQAFLNGVAIKEVPITDLYSREASLWRCGWKREARASGNAQTIRAAYKYTEKLWNRSPRIKAMITGITDEFLAH